MAVSFCRRGARLGSEVLERLSKELVDCTVPGIATVCYLFVNSLLFSLSSCCILLG